jgi:chromate transporter
VSTLLFGTLGLSATDWLALFGHFLLLSLLAIGGAMTTAPDMQRFVVGQQGWLSDAQFAASIALAQAAPGPNVLFVAVIGFNVGGVAGALATLVGTLLPSTLLTLHATRWGERRRDTRLLRAFRTGLAPLTLGLLAATGWILFEPAAAGNARWGSAVLAAATLAVMLRTRWSPLVPIALGAVAGALGLAG